MARTCVVNPRSTLQRQHLLQISTFPRTTLVLEPYEIEVGIPSTIIKQDSNFASRRQKTQPKGLEAVSPESTRVYTRAVRKGVTHAEGAFRQLPDNSCYSPGLNTENHRMLYIYIRVIDQRGWLSPTGVVFSRYGVGVVTFVFSSCSSY